MMLLRRILYFAGLVALFAGIVAVWLSYPHWISKLASPEELSQQVSALGTFGDAFGGLNTLFSGLAFAGIIVSIFLQSRELRETRKELREQKDQFVLQNESLKKQVFENTFFQLIHLHNEITEKVTAQEEGKPGSPKVVGRRAIGALLDNYIEGRYKFYFPGEAEATTTSEKWGLFHVAFHHEIGHYFRNIYQILKFIDTSGVEDKLFYSNLLRAQLSSDELALLFYNCLSEFGSKKFKPLLERYEFLEHLPTYNHISEEDARMYDLKAYGQSTLWRQLLGVEG